MQPVPDRSNAGFTLLETVVATGILVTALAGVAHLLSLSVHSTREAGVQGVALTATQAKLEALRSLALRYSDEGLTITHPDLTPSPPSSLVEDTPGCVDFLDHEGNAIEGEGAGSFTRRWRVAPIDDRVPDALVIEVCVFRSPADGLTPVSAQACLATVRARRP